MPNQTPIWDVLALGEVMTCFEERADGLYARDCGGDALNVAVAVARMGGQAAIAARLGSGAGTPEALSVCARTGVDIGPIQKGCAAPNAHQIIPKAGARTTMRAGTAAALWRPGDLAATDVANARVIHLSGGMLGQSEGVSMAAKIAVEQARAAGVLVSFDPVFDASLWSEDVAISALLVMAAQADVIFVTAADAAFLFGSADPATVLDRVLGHGPQVVVLSLPEGAWVATGAGRSFVARPAEFGRYTLASRETLIGTFLSGLTAGDDLVVTVARALLAAQLASHVPGAAASIPALEDLLTYPETAISPSAAREQPMNAGP